MHALQEVLKIRAEQTPDAEALVGGHTRYSFRAYLERVNQLSHYLLELGVEKGDRVAILCKNNHPYPTIMMAALTIGAIVVPLNHLYTSHELEGITKHCQPKVLFYDKEFEAALPNKQPLPFLIRAGEGMATSTPFDEIFMGRYPVTEPSVTVSESDTAFFMFTSGTTGNPKACELIHRGFSESFKEVFSYPSANSNERFLAVHHLYHLSSVFNMIYSIISGTTLVFLTESDPATIWGMIDKEKITRMFAFPHMYTYMLQEFKSSRRKTTSLKIASVGGTKVPSTLILQYHELGITMSAGYGCTEGLGISHYSPEMGIDRADSAGMPMPNVECKIVHPEKGEDLPAGEIGEIVVKSPYVFKGYWKNPEATSKVLREGWLHTGDSGKLDEDGFLYVLGRYKDVIISGGRNIYPDQVEDVIMQIPHVLEAAVVAVPDGVLGEIPRAYIVKETGSMLSEDEVHHYCKQRFASYKVPQIRFTDALPKNSLGKVMKRILREQAT
ncbi:class I adenylate-forming enzyme family protein [Paenibacillus apiarius]|uniref:AMP-binding protein n=1 Tax=Paenibacillus apiarius TaxID=46240 RepID=A0ABT4DZ95_9BACL|nr:AMP-binding protein [Paenibacillus apiarius]MCY9517853.1 AMP-binding protein [Paenibacillus apiarius]MCY9522682.1 AMP-binding protein [Paenibacillus apiarius]MCY9555367.1 AMP-binding protein [Paenibacillus apiarius]MCY9561247.1 AMP-binding protein [Paenibacillus apiarius]MCY9686560.1 AMP-binding protein [Paenibacillus apiarius]